MSDSRMSLYVPSANDVMSLGGFGAARCGLWRRLRVLRRPAPVCVGKGGAPAKPGVGDWVGEVQGGEVELALESNRPGMRWRGNSTAQGRRRRR